MWIRARREAVIRTRLDAATVRERIEEIVAMEEPEGMKRLMADGYFCGGYAGPREFAVSYRFNSHKNPQVYEVRGVIEETPDWRVVRLALQAEEPWMDKWQLGFATLLLAVMAYGQGRGAGFVVAGLAFLALLYGFANLLYIPDKVTGRVAALLAARLRGSVQHGSEWVVPPTED
jgi:hypothetical protein